MGKGGAQVGTCLLKGAQMTFAGREDIFRGLPAGLLKQAVFKCINPCPGFGRNIDLGERAGGESRGLLAEVNFVPDRDPGTDAGICSRMR